MTVPARRANAHHDLNRYVVLSDREIASELRRLLARCCFEGDWKPPWLGEKSAACYMVSQSITRAIGSYLNHSHCAWSA